MPTINPSRPSPSNSNGEVGNSLFDEVKVPEEAPGGGGSIAIPGSNMGAVEADAMSEYTPDVYTGPPSHSPHSRAAPHHLAPLDSDDHEGEMLIPSRPSSSSPTRMRPPSVKQIPEVEEKIEMKKERVRATRPQRQLAPMFFKEITGDFERILKPYYGMFACESAVEAPGQDSSDGTSGDCVHPILAVEPSNPSTPPRTFKIHKQRLVIKPGYTYVEPVLLDLPVNPLNLSHQGLQNILLMTGNMKPIPPRIDNFTHHPPSDMLLKPSFHVPKKYSKKFVPSLPIGSLHTGTETRQSFGSSCGHSSKKMFL